MWIRRAQLIIAFCFLFVQAFGQELKVDVAAVKSVIAKWNDAHAKNTIGNFSSLYADTVHFHGSPLTRQKCLSIKRSMLEKKDDFEQALKNELVLAAFSSGAIRCDFTKTVIEGNESVDFRSYLVLKEINGNYKIVGEGHLITEQNVSNVPDLGTRVKIKEVSNTIGNNAETKNTIDPEKDESMLSSWILLIASLLVGVIGLALAFRFKVKNNTKKFPVDAEQENNFAVVQEQSNYSQVKQEAVVTATKTKSELKFRSNVLEKATRSNLYNSGEYRKEDAEKGRDFENFVTEQFAFLRNYFKLIDWRSDKFYRGIYAESSQKPDLVYRFTHENYSRTFAIECKYRSKTYRGSIEIMDEKKYKIYEDCHRNEMPVYIVVGVGGKASWPAELYLIPFEDAKLIMYNSELSMFEKRGRFFYDKTIDRLT